MKHVELEECVEYLKQMEYMAHEEQGEQGKHVDYEEQVEYVEHEENVKLVKHEMIAFLSHLAFAISCHLHHADCISLGPCKSYLFYVNICHLLFLPH